jgi:zinc D-Ala-D-Ala dipeptidase
MKPYHAIPIQDCGEPLIEIPSGIFDWVVPHPYEALGAPYGDKSPFSLRQGVLERLQMAQIILQQAYPTWQLQIFDAYRPIPVQQFMVDYSFAELLQMKGLVADALTHNQRQTLMQDVYQFWAPPSPDPTTPPPHSTGAAIDLTLVDEHRVAIAMGSPIDELSPRSYPDHFAESDDPNGHLYHAHRQLLFRVMRAAGFQRHPNEWWHFSWGDQLWAWQTQEQTQTLTTACYGRVEPFPMG